MKAGAAVYTGAQGHTWQAMAASQFANDHCTMFIAAFCAAGVLGLTTPPPPCDVGDVTGDAVIGVQLGDWCRAQRAHEIVVEALGMPFVDFVVNWIDNYDAGDAVSGGRWCFLFLLCARVLLFVLLKRPNVIVASTQR